MKKVKEKKPKPRRDQVKNAALNKKYNSRILGEYIDYDYLDQLDEETLAYLNKFTEEFHKASYKHDGTDIQDYETYGKELIGADFGAYTRRKRAFLVGCLRDQGERKVFNFPVGNKPTFSTRGSEDILPICLPWKGGVPLERLGSCVITEINSVRTM